MANTLLRDLDEDLLAAYRAAALANGQSLNTALKAGLERGRPRSHLSVAERLALSCALVADSPPTQDSTPYLRWARATDEGRRQSDRDEFGS